MKNIHAAKCGLTAAALLLAFPVGSQSLKTPEIKAGTLKGNCQYNANAFRLLDGTNGFANCNGLVIKRNGNKASFDFRRGSWGSMVRYDGDLSGDVMTIDHIKLRGKQLQAAEGTCTVYWHEQFGDGMRVSTVTCVAKVAQMTYVANFMVSRINLD